MKKALIYCLLTISLASLSSAQTKPRSDDPLGIKEFLRNQPQETKPSITIFTWTEDSPSCDRFAIDGVYFHTFHLNGVTVAASFKDTGSYLHTRVLVLNRSENPILVEPQHVQVFYVDKKENSVSLLPLEPEKIAERYAKRVMWAGILNSLAAGMAQRTSTVSTVSRGTINSANGTSVYNITGTSTITEPDYAAQLQTTAQNAANARRVAIEREEFLSNALRANTVLPGGSTGGDLYFKRTKFKKGALIIRIGNVDYFLIVFRDYPQ